MIQLFPMFADLPMGDRHVVVKSYGDLLGRAQTAWHAAELVRQARMPLPEIQRVEIHAHQLDMTALAARQYIIGLDLPPHTCPSPTITYCPNCSRRSE
jgi:hypothetical protein